MTYALDGIRRSLLNGAGIQDQVETVGILLVMGAILIPASIAIFGWADLHCHPMAHLGFGGANIAVGGRRLFWGDPDGAEQSALPGVDTPDDLRRAEAHWHALQG